MANFVRLSFAATLRDIVNVVNRIISGGLDVTGDVTLTANTTTTTVQDRRISKDAVLILTPTTSNAAAALGTTYLSTRTPGASFVLTHANNAQSDKTFKYALLG